MKSLESLLLQFGFTSGESELYLALLELGPTSAPLLAKKLEKNRASIYFHVKGLLQKKILFETRQGKKTFYAAIPASELIEKVSQRTNELKTYLPYLETLQTVRTEKPLIHVTESKQGYLQIYEEISSLPEGSFFCVLEGKRALKNELGLVDTRAWNQFFKKIINRGILTKALFTDTSLRQPQTFFTGEDLRLLRTRLWQVRTLAEETLPFDDLILLYGDTVAFLFPESAFVTIIRHRRIKKSLQILFDTLFLNAHPVKEPWEQK